MSFVIAEDVAKEYVQKSQWKHSMFQVDWFSVWLDFELSSKSFEHLSLDSKYLNTNLVYVSRQLTPTS